ncbi:hypothetical protein EXS70_00070 [Candidatus Peribacteria bacterium]|nr:hypothetical protein [Candidatus Peribacteria bacterium]
MSPDTDLHQETYSLHARLSERVDQEQAGTDAPKIAPEIMEAQKHVGQQILNGFSYEVLRLKTAQRELDMASVAVTGELMPKVSADAHAQRDELEQVKGRMLGRIDQERVKPYAHQLAIDTLEQFLSLSDADVQGRIAEIREVQQSFDETTAKMTRDLLADDDYMTERMRRGYQGPVGD